MEQMDTLKRLKKAEEEADDSIKKAQDKAAKMLEEAKARGEKIIIAVKEASNEAKEEALAALERDTKKEEAKLLEQAEKEAQKINPIDDSQALQIIEKAIKEGLNL